MAGHGRVLPAVVSRWSRIGLILASTLCAYSPTLKLGFIWDDYYNVQTNASLRQWSWANIQKDFTQPIFRLPNGHGLYRPLQPFTHRMEYSLWGLRPLGYHLVNVLIHAGNAILCAVLALGIGVSPWAATWAGCLIGAHPIIVQELLMVSGRAELMSLFFSLLSMVIFIRRPRGWLFLSPACFALALFTKESAVMTPILIALLMTYRKESFAFYRPLVWFLIPLGIYITMYRLALPLPSSPVEAPIMARFFLQAFPTVILHYAGLIFWPWPLYTDRLLPHWSFPWIAGFAAFVGVVACMMSRRWALGLLGMGWFLVQLLPKSFVMLQQSLLLDHWAYAGLWGMVVPAAVGIGVRRQRLTAPRQRLLNGFCAVFVLVLATLTQANVQLRGSNEKLYRWALRFPTSETMKSNLAFLLFEERRWNEAYPLLRELHQNNPNDTQLKGVLTFLQNVPKPPFPQPQDP